MRYLMSLLLLLMLAGCSKDYITRPEVKPAPTTSPDTTDTDEDEEEDDDD